MPYNTISPGTYILNVGFDSTDSVGGFTTKYGFLWIPRLSTLRVKLELEFFFDGASTLQKTYQRSMHYISALGSIGAVSNYPNVISPFASITASDISGNYVRLDYIRGNVIGTDTYNTLINGTITVTYF